MLALTTCRICQAIFLLRRPRVDFAMELITHHGAPPLADEAAIASLVKTHSAQCIAAKMVAGSLAVLSKSRVRLVIECIADDEVIRARMALQSLGFVSVGFTAEGRTYRDVLALRMKP